MAGSAPRLARVVAHPADDEEFVVGARRSSVPHALDARRHCAADDADRGEPRHLVGAAEELGDDAEGPAPETLIETADNCDPGVRGHPLEDGAEARVEDLRFLDADDFRLSPLLRSVSTTRRPDSDGVPWVPAPSDSTR